MVTPGPEDHSGLIGRVTGRVAGEVTGRVVGSIDPNVVLDNVDVDAVLDRVDVDRLLDRVDVDRLLDRVDIDRLLGRVNTQELVQRAGVPDVVAASTGRFAGSALDSARRQLVSLDVLWALLVDRVLRRRTLGWRHAPAKLRPTVPRLQHGRLDVTGRYAGPATRLVAVIADIWLVTAGFTVALAGADYLDRTLFGRQLAFDSSGPWWVPALMVVAFFYSFLGLQVAGRTPGKALVGLRVVGWDGSELTAGASFFRTVLLPVGLLFLGVGLLLGLVQRDRRTLHDLVARTAVVVDWAPRQAELTAALSRALLDDPA